MKHYLITIYGVGNEKLSVGVYADTRLEAYREGLRQLGFPPEALPLSELQITQL